MAKCGKRDSKGGTVNVGVFSSVFRVVAEEEAEAVVVDAAGAPHAAAVVDVVLPAPLPPNENPPAAGAGAGAAQRSEGQCSTAKGSTAQSRAG
eukprot:1632180-Ditylum_brightwellii.AAC.1